MQPSHLNFYRTFLVASLLSLALASCSSKESKEVADTKSASSELPAEMTTPDASLPEASAPK